MIEKLTFTDFDELKSKIEHFLDYKEVTDIKLFQKPTSEGFSYDLEVEYISEEAKDLLLFKIIREKDKNILESKANKIKSENDVVFEHYSQVKIPDKEGFYYNALIVFLE